MRNMFNGQVSNFMTLRAHNAFLSCSILMRLFILYHDFKNAKKLQNFNEYVQCPNLINLSRDLNSPKTGFN